MARRRTRKRKKRARSKRKTPVGRLLLGGGLVLLAVSVIGAFLLYIALRGYLHSGKFSAMVAEQVSTLFEAEGEFEPFRWSGTTAYTEAYRADGYGGALFSKLKAERIEGRVNFGAVRRGVWEISNIDVGRVNVRLTGERADGAGAGDVGDAGGEDADTAGGGGGLLAGFIPDKVELMRAAIGELNIDAAFDGLRVTGRDSSVELKPTAAEEVFRVSVRGGDVTASGYPDLELQEVELRAGPDGAIVDRAEFTFYDGASLDANGDIKAGDSPVLDLELRIRDLPAEKVLPEDWAKKLTGTVAVDATAGGWPGRGSGLRLNGDVVLDNGVLEAVPVLERADQLLGSSKFRRLTFSEFRIKFDRRGSDTDLVDVFALAQGALCLKGHLDLPTDGEPRGAYMLGITTDTISWMPIVKKAVLESVFAHSRDEAYAAVFGADSTVSKPPEGFRWAIASVMPTELDPYTADLRRQLSEAGGLAILAELAGASKDVVAALDVMGTAAQEQGVELMALLGDGAGEGSIFAPSNIQRVAGELGVARQVGELLEGVVGTVQDAAGGAIGVGLKALEGLFGAGR